MGVPFPNPVTLEQMQANRRHLNATFFSRRPRMKNLIPEQPPTVPAEPEPAPEIGPAHRAMSDREIKILDAVATRAQITLDDMLTGLTRTAALGRQVAVVLLTRSLTSEPMHAAMICGLTLGAAGRALSQFDPILDGEALPVLNDPLGCIEPLWRHAVGNLQDRRTATLAECINAASRASSVSVHDIKGARRLQEYVKARQIAMWLATQFTLLSLPSIGRTFGRDHTTILHGSRTVAPIAATIMAEEHWGLQEWADALWAADWPSIQRRAA